MVLVARCKRRSITPRIVSVPSLHFRTFKAVPKGLPYFLLPALLHTIDNMHSSRRLRLYVTCAYKSATGLNRQLYRLAVLYNLALRSPKGAYYRLIVNWFAVALIVSYSYGLEYFICRVVLILSGLLISIANGLCFVKCFWSFSLLVSVLYLLVTTHCYVSN